MRHGPLRHLTPDQQAMVEANLGACFLAAGRLVTPALSYDERVSACYLGLCHAVRTFDAQKGSLMSHIFRWSRSMIQQDIARNADIVHTPRQHRPLLRDGLDVDRVPSPGERSWTGIETRSTLPLRTRVMLRLRYDEGLDYWEIGQVFGIGSQAASAAIRRGLHLIQQEGQP